MHDLRHGAEGVCGVIEVFCEATILIVVAKGSLVFFIPYEELPSSLSYIRLIAIGAGEFVGAPL
jgi:hypothetical protein